MKKLFFALLWLCNAQAQAIAFPLDKAQVPTGYLYNLAVPLAYLGSTPPKALIFTFFIRQSHFIRRSHSEGGSGGGKTQHRRRWPQPSLLPSPFLERGRG